MGRARAQAKHDFLGYDTNKNDNQRPYVSENEGFWFLPWAM